MIKIGITERGDPGLDFSWLRKVKNYDGLILITKSLSDRFIDSVSNLNCIVHATITGLAGTVYEPNVIKFADSIPLFLKLIDVIGPERVVLRIDPIIPGLHSSPLNVYKLLHEDIYKKTRVIISFLDNYPHVKERFKSAGLNLLSYNFHAPFAIRKSLASKFPDGQLCGEPGFECVGCVSKKDLEILGINSEFPKYSGFQRKECRCLGIKKEIFEIRGRCQNKCLYCYWKD